MPASKLVLKMLCSTDCLSTCCPAVKELQEQAELQENGSRDRVLYDNFCSPSVPKQE